MMPARSPEYGIIPSVNSTLVTTMYQIIFYVPTTHLEPVKNAMFEAGAGKFDNYTHCAWQVLGEGQFMPLNGSDPFIGNTNEVERVPEYKVEMFCPKNVLTAVIEALKSEHPYEVPAYHVIKLENG